VNIMERSSGRQKADLVLHNIGELVTLSGNSARPVRHPNVESLGVLNTRELCLASSSGKIAFIGRRSDLSSELSASAAEEIDCKGKLVMPGFVDSHTHSIFAGSREQELSAKLEGMSYLDILKSGGGILRTVRETNQASDQDIISQTVDRLGRMNSFGTTTFEVKTGYSLTVSGEIRLLEIIAKIKRDFGFDIVPTILSAHAIPLEYQGRPDAFISEVVFPSINVSAERKLAIFCDVFLEDGVFGYRDTEAILLHASRIGLFSKIHADEFSDQGGAALGGKLNVVSADHLGRSSLEGINSLAKSSAVAVLLPGTLFSSFVGTYAKARQFIDLGVPVAIATDLSPNSWIESMQFIIALACYGMRITVEEAIVAATINGAHALARAGDIGSLEIGKQSDLLICSVDNYRQIPYRIACNVVDKVVKKGEVVACNL
jgi:imidazolonepropionase